jgi:hypothetical protein
MDIAAYFGDVSEELQRRSDRIRLGFSSHEGLSGANREELVAAFLSENLPAEFVVDTGLILCSTGEFSNEADIVIIDRLRNAPLFSDLQKKLWLVESVYGLIEVKTQLTPTTLTDAVEKCARFKRLPRHFADVPALPRLSDSLAIVWAWEGPSPEVAKANLLDVLRGIPAAEQPDFVIVPGKYLAVAGSYRELGSFGQPRSRYRLAKEEQLGRSAEQELAERPVEVWDMGTHSLLAWLGWLVSWLQGAGSRSAPMLRYLQQGDQYGRLL